MENQNPELVNHLVRLALLVDQTLLFGKLTHFDVIELCLPLDRVTPWQFLRFLGLIEAKRQVGEKGRDINDNVPLFVFH